MTELSELQDEVDYYKRSRDEQKERANRLWRLADLIEVIDDPTDASGYMGGRLVKVVRLKHDAGMTPEEWAAAVASEMPF